ncbi:hypothetical protein VH1709_contig00008-0269 [Vibrio harveyi]|nr:hypothetical protein VH1709_contig00008-0269 [Vibrio harveyi]
MKNTHNQSNHLKAARNGNSTVEVDGKKLLKKIKQRKTRKRYTEQESITFAKHVNAAARQC